MSELESARMKPPGQEEVNSELSETLTEAFEAQGKILREKILFGLTVYPALSPSMLHVFLGTATPKALWKDVVLRELIEEGLVVKTEVTLTSPNERTQTYSVLHLSTTSYEKPACVEADENTSDNAS